MWSGAPMTSPCFAWADNKELLSVYGLAWAYVMIPITQVIITTIPSCGMMITAESKTHHYGIGRTVIQSAKGLKN